MYLFFVYINECENKNHILPSEQKKKTFFMSAHYFINMLFFLNIVTYVTKKNYTKPTKILSKKSIHRAISKLYIFYYKINATLLLFILKVSK